MHFLLTIASDGDIVECGVRSDILPPETVKTDPDIGKLFINPIQIRFQANQIQCH